jgi:phage baseplate assembly protein W
MAKSINIRLPFENSTDGGVFATNRITAQALTDDLLSLMTAKKGSRVMRSGIYSPIFDYLNEQIDDPTKQNLSRDIKKKVAEYLPQIDVLDVRIDLSDQDENILNVKILFTSKSIYNITQSLVVSVPLNQGTVSAQ